VSQDVRASGKRNGVLQLSSDCKPAGIRVFFACYASDCPMMLVASRSKRSRCRAWVAAISAVAFAILVSIAATHLHIGLDADEACAVCAAVIGKLEGPSAPAAVVSPVGIAYLWLAPRIFLRVEQVFLVVLPPSRGPPRFA
jgi:hypothetical protein